jgi:hypothetical protein
MFQFCILTFYFSDKLDPRPLILGWAISIHKSQGQTIHRVKVDLGRVFEKGHISLSSHQFYHFKLLGRSKLCRSLPRIFHRRSASNWFQSEESYCPPFNK